MTYILNCFPFFWPKQMAKQVNRYRYNSPILHFILRWSCECLSVCVCWSSRSVLFLSSTPAWFVLKQTNICQCALSSHICSLWFRSLCNGRIWRFVLPLKWPDIKKKNIDYLVGPAGLWCAADLSFGISCHFPSAAKIWQAHAKWTTIKKNTRLNWKIQFEIVFFIFCWKNLLDILNSLTWQTWQTTLV